MGTTFRHNFRRDARNFARDFGHIHPEVAAILKAAGFKARADMGGEWYTLYGYDDAELQFFFRDNERHSDIYFIWYDSVGYANVKHEGGIRSVKRIKSIIARYNKEQAKAELHDFNH